MKIYSVFLRPGLSSVRSWEDIQFIKQGVHWEALLITPVWAIRQKLWLALALWIVAIGVIAVVAAMAHLGGLAIFSLYLVCVVAFGLEADRFRQAYLGKAGFYISGLAFGASQHEAEEVFFASRKGQASPAPTTILGSFQGRAIATSASAADTDLLGLFPSREPKP